MPTRRTCCPGGGGRPAPPTMRPSGFGVMSALLAASTWRTPPEWGRLVEAAEEVRRLTPRGEMLVAPEALLYQADRRGYRLENTRESATRAAKEWGVAMEGPIEPFE